MDTIYISGIRIFAYHGVFQQEKEDGQTFLLDLELQTDLAKASRSDRLDDTVDYADVCETVNKTMTDKKYNLIERVGGEICDVLLERYPTVTMVKVTIKKPEIRLCCDIDYAAVSITRSRVC